MERAFSVLCRQFSSDAISYVGQLRLDGGDADLPLSAPHLLPDGHRLQLH